MAEQTPKKLMEQLAMQAGASFTIRADMTRWKMRNRNRYDEWAERDKVGRMIMDLSPDKRELLRQLKSEDVQSMDPMLKWSDTCQQGDDGRSWLAELNNGDVVRIERAWKRRENYFA